MRRKGEKSLEKVGREKFASIRPSRNRRPGKKKKKVPCQGKGNQDRESRRGGSEREEKPFGSVVGKKKRGEHHFHEEEKREEVALRLV